MWDLESFYLMADIAESMFVNGIDPVDENTYWRRRKRREWLKWLAVWGKQSCEVLASLSSALTLRKTQRRESRKIEEMWIVTAVALASVELGLKSLMAASGFICAKAPQQ